MTEEQRDHHVQSVSVTRLFGRYTYSLPSEGSSLSEINIIYGQNGAGKTTLLTLVFHLLSPSLSVNHRSAISEIPFAELVVTLADGTMVSATKDPQLLLGPVKFAIKPPASDSIEWTYFPGPRAHAIRPEDIPQHIDINKLPRDMRDEVVQGLRQRKFFEEIGKLRVAAYMLTSDRMLQGDSVQELMAPPSDSRATRKRLSEMMSQYRTSAVSEAMQKASSWLQTKIFQGSYGRQSAAVLYLDVVRKIAKTTYRTRTGLNKSQEERTITSLTNSIGEITNRANALAKFGIVTSTVSPEILTSIQQSRGNRLHLINTILEPYLGGIKASLDSVTPIYELLDRFVSTINKFLQDKQITYSLHNGLNIVIDPSANEQQILQPSQLSSGEQQLLLMFCHVLTARDAPSIFIIDEPELSLNIIWQRMLVNALHEIAKDADVQFLFASHSMEIITKHKNRVITLQEAKHA